MNLITNKYISSFSNRHPPSVPRPFPTPNSQPTLAPEASGLAGLPERPEDLPPLGLRVAQPAVRHEVAPHEVVPGRHLPLAVRAAGDERAVEQALLPVHLRERI